ncbi:MAG: Ig-like domain-containing protein [Euryarchaeota archaeon]|nr:Ig-like domain-containing protein [Euryarchaeota archaeon]
MINREVRRKRLWDAGGVSEVVGTILMLAITVVLFSSMIVFVGNMPTPKESVSVDIQGTIDPDTNWANGANITLVKRGGVDLDNESVMVVVTVNSTYYTLRLQIPGPDGLDGTDRYWNTGESWRYHIPAGFVNSSSSVDIVIVDTVKLSFVWRANLRPETGANHPPVIIDAWADSDLSTPERESVNYGQPYWVFARVMDFENNMNLSDPASVQANLGSIGAGTVNLYDPDGDGIYNSSEMTGPDLSVHEGYYPFNITAKDVNATSPQKVILVAVGGELGEQPIVFVKSIAFSNGMPVRGSTTTITAEITNNGMGRANVTVFFNDTLATNNIYNTTIGLPYGSRFVDYNWLAAPGGQHVINVSVILHVNEPAGFLPEKDTSLNDNYLNANITVLPKILLVDDDGHTNDGSDADTSRFLRGALESSNFEYDFTSVSSGDGPGWVSGDFKLKNYDVLIWNTGYQTANTLTARDMTDIHEFLTNMTNRTKPGSFWLISQGLYADNSAPGVGTRQTFTQTEFQATVSGAVTPLVGSVNGLDGDVVSDYLFHGAPLTLVNRGTGVAGEANGYSITGNLSLVPIGWTAGNPGYGAEYVTPLDSRRYFTPWEFSRISTSAEQAQFAYKVLTWVGNISGQFGKDLAISQQTMSSDVIYYKQPVTITAVVRNNGLENITGVYVRMNIYYQGVEVNRTDVGPLSFTNMTGASWFQEVSFNWTPEFVGNHRIIVMVDPDNLIAETNENNNVLSDFLSAGDIDVRYRILLVNDTQDSAAGNERNIIATALDSLGYTYENWTVGNTTSDGPSLANLSNYNSVLWSCGLSGAPSANDTGNLGSYLNGKGTLWLTGRSAVPTSGLTAFHTDKLGISAATSSLVLRNMSGVANDNVSHGIRYAVGNAGVNYFTVNAVAGGVGALRSDAQTGAVVGVRCTDGYFKTVTTSFSVTDLNATWPGMPNGTEARAELAYLVLHWFGLPDVRVEMRLSSMDLGLSSTHPQLGSAYVIQATVRNFGGSDGNALVRFMDGSTQIGSDSVSVGADGKTTAEVIWMPLFAGMRTVTVQVDPINEQAEVFEWFNNNASFSTYVYYFYDDMEEGLAKWRHESTIMLINGESPIDYFGTTQLFTNIQNSWNYTQSQNLTNITDVSGFYHTYNKAAWLQEPQAANTTQQGTRKPMDVVFALDTSGSMDGAKIINLRIATCQFIANLTDQDRAGMWTFDGGGDGTVRPWQRYNLTWMTDANKLAMMTTINATAANGYTPFYDTLGKAIVDAIQFDPTCTDTTRLEYVVGETDGQSNNDRWFTPNCDWGTTMTDNEYTFNNNNVNNMQGLPKCPPMVFVVGLSLGAYHWNTSLPNNLYPADGWYAPGYNESYINAVHPLEKDLFNCANTTPRTRDTPTSNPMNYGYNSTAWDGVLPPWCQPRPNIGHYFHCTDPTKLGSIFGAIFQDIGGGVNVPPENVTGAPNPVIINSEPEPVPTTNSEPAPVTVNSVPSQGSEPGINAAPQPPGTDAIFTQTRYMRGVANEVTVNTLTAYSLNTTQSATTQSVPSMGDGGTVAAGIRVWKRAAGGAETEITAGTAVAIATLASNTEGLYSNTWTPAATALASTDSIVVRVYADCNINPPTTLRATFTTEQLGGNQLDNVQWTVWYYLRRSSTGAGDDRWYWGTSTYNSRIVNFQYRTPNLPPNAPTNPVPSNGTVGVSTTFNFSWQCTDPEGSPLVYDVYMGTTSPPATLVANDIAVNYTSQTLSPSTIYYWYVVANDSQANNTGSAIWVFATSSPTNPTASPSPANQTTGVPITMNYTVTFSKTMNNATGTPNIAQSPNNPPTTAGTWRWFNTNTTLIYTGVAWAYNTTYWVNLTGYRDMDGRWLQNYSWWFTTVSGSLPYITYTGPADGDTGVANNTAIVVIFSNPMDTSSVFYNCTPNPGGWTPAWSNGDTRLTLAHTNFADSTYYTMNVTAGRDKSGQPLQNDTMFFDSFEADSGWGTYGGNGEWERNYPRGLGGNDASSTPPGNPDPTSAYRGANVLGNDLTGLGTQLGNYEDGLATQYIRSRAINCLGHSSVWLSFYRWLNCEAQTYDPASVQVSNDNTAWTTVWSVGGGTQFMDSSWNYVSYDISAVAANRATVYVRFSIASDGGWTYSGWNIDNVMVYDPTVTGVPNTWSFTTGSPTQSTASPSPSDGASGVSTTVPYVISFSKAMNPSYGGVTFSPVPTGGTWGWSANGRYYNYTGVTWAYLQAYVVTVTNFIDATGVSMPSYTWTFTTMAQPASGGNGSTPGLAPAGANVNKSAVTESVDLRNVSRATLSFWHKYNMVSGVNGGVLMLGWKNITTGNFTYKYIVPSSAYTGNLRLNDTNRTDDFGNWMRWGWNGVSGDGRFDWEYVTLNLLPYLPSDATNLSAVRVKFAYYQYGGGTGYGWYIDDVKITVTRSDARNATATDADVWARVNKNTDTYFGGAWNHSSHSGSYAWWNGDNATGYMKAGIDNCLVTNPIDMTNCKYAILSAYFKFNVNTADGRPPDGFRVEISTDNGVTWNSINLGVRAGWGVSGTDNTTGNTTTYTGITDSRNATADGYWVNAGTLTRLNVDLTPFAGNAIMLRFRTVTTNHAAYAHSSSTGVGFGGFYVDDVIVYGETILG